MKKSQLVRILQTFNKKEVRELRKWVNSPAHNLRQDVIDLFEYLFAGNHLHSETYLRKEKVFEAIYPDKTFSDAEARQVMYFLLKTVEEYLVNGEVLQDQIRAQVYLTRAYRQKQLSSLFEKAMATGEQMQEKSPYRDYHYFENEYLFQFEQYTYLSGLGRDVPLNLHRVSDANDIAYLSNKFRLGCIMRSHQAVFKTDYDFELLENLLNYVENYPEFLGYPAISIYYYSYRAITEKESALFFEKLKELILKSGSLFSHDEIRVIYLLAINYCIGQINAGQKSFFRESFELFTDGIEKDIFLEDGILSRFTFSNAIRVALNLKEFDWTEDFIKSSTPLLDEKYRENYERFYMARLLFERKNYEMAMQLLAQFEYDDILMSLHAKTMLIKMYYELDEFNALDSLIESMRAYLQRKKVMGYHRSIYKNLIALFKKLLKIRPGDKEQIKKLSEEIAMTEPLMERRWLLEQLEKLS